MKVLDFPASRIDPADPKVAAGMARLMDDLDLFDAIIGHSAATEAALQAAPLPIAA
ncbi:hypothetical protein DVS28_b0352 (plasmid) [Euzebya pacifica]|uniref:Uncharacterized protein n=1 Tax=Euzebya pacifica TaxID=1608957 RepID=A0A346Y6M5_9ACTN|nr:hypothetical protein [Euzebya pacifica]AXV10122.1 hypothetical protein DVS28_b0352 [Euzebya pacifica]